MYITKEKNGSVATVRPVGRLSVYDLEEFHQNISDFPSDVTKVVLDAEELDFISASCARALLSIRKRLADNSCFEIINCNSVVKKMLVSMGFDTLMTISEKTGCDPLRCSWKDILADRVQTCPNTVCITDGDRNYTWQDIEIASQILAHEMSHKGIGNLAHVGIIDTNNINFIIAFFAIQKLGAVAVLFNPELSFEEVADLCETGDVTDLCIGDTTHLTCFDEVQEKLMTKCALRSVFRIDRSVDFTTRSGEYESIRSLLREPVPIDSPSVIIFSSGSTGKPKAVLLSAFNILSGSKKQIDRWNITEQDTMCLAIPLYHIFGFKVGFVYSLIMNNRICIPADTHSETIMAMVEREQCTQLPLVPTMMLAITEKKSFTKERLASVRTSVLAGSALSEPQMLKIMGKLPHVCMVNLYGLSEFTPLSSTLYGDTPEHVCQTIGIPAEGIEVKIADPGTGASCAIGESGEILARGHNQFICYYKASAEIQSIDGEDWLHTGDLGLLDENGYLHLTGRLKEIIIRGGENIIPNEVASAISEHENIKEVLVIGVPDDFYGEIVGACVSLYDNSKWDEAALNEFLSTRLAGFKIPARYLVYENELPKLSNGKYDRQTMKHDFENGDRFL